MKYYKDAATGTYPLAVVDPVDNPDLVEITKSEYEAVVAAGADVGHPMRTEVKYAAEIAEASKELPPPGFVAPGGPDGSEPSEPRDAVIEETK